MKQLFNGIVFLLMISVAVTQTARAEGAEGKEGDKKYEMEEVIVTGARVQEKVSETPATVNVVSKKEVERVKYRNPAELLNRVPGVTLRNFEGEDALASIRVPAGFTNPYTLVLVDGLPATSFGDGSAGLWKELNSADIESIEVVKGPASALYGSNAIGGVVNIITRKPSGVPQLRLWGEYGLYDYWRGGAVGNISKGDFSFSLNTNFIKAEGWRQNSEQDKKAATAKIVYTPDAVSFFDFRLEYVSLDNQTPGTLTKAQFDADWRQDFYDISYTKLEKLTPSLSYTRTVGEGGELKATVLMRRIMDHESIPTYEFFGSSSNGKLNKVKGTDFNVQLLYKQDLTFLRSRLIGGVDVERGTNEVDKYNIIASRVDNHFVSYRVTGIDKSYEIDTTVLSPYVQYEMSPLDKLRFTVGGRYDTVTYDLADKKTPSGSGDTSFSKITFKTGVTYDLSKNLNPYISYSQGFVAPTTSQLFTSSYSNKDLNAEEADNYEIGLRSTFWDQRIRFDLAYYFMTIKDKIIAQKETTTIYRNAGETSHNGIEAVAVVHPVDLIRVTLAYTYARNIYEDFKDPGSHQDYTGNRLPGMPEHHLNARLAFLPAKGLDVELEMDAVSTQFSDNANTQPYSRPTLFNLRATYDTKKWSLWAHLINITDERYAAYVSGDTIKYYSGSPRTFFVGVAYNWGK